MRDNVKLPPLKRRSFLRRKVKKVFSWHLAKMGCLLGFALLAGCTSRAAKVPAARPPVPVFLSVDIIRQMDVGREFLGSYRAYATPGKPWAGGTRTFQGYTRICRTAPGQSISTPDLLELGDWVEAKPLGVEEHRLILELHWQSSQLEALDALAVEGCRSERPKVHRHEYHGTVTLTEGQPVLIDIQGSPNSGERYQIRVVAFGTYPGMPVPQQ